LPISHTPQTNKDPRRLFSPDDVGRFRNYSQTIQLVLLLFFQHDFSFFQAGDLELITLAEAVVGQERRGQTETRTRKLHASRCHTSIHPFDLVEFLIQRHQLREMIFQGGFGNIEGIHNLLGSFTFGDHGAKFHGVEFRCDRHRGDSLSLHILDCLRRGVTLNFQTVNFLGMMTG